MTRILVDFPMFDGDEFGEHTYVDPMEVDIDGHLEQLEEAHQPSLEELEDLFTSPEILQDCG